MHRHLSIKRKRRAGLTSVEYAVMLFLVGVTALFGIPELQKTISGSATRTGTTIDKVATSDVAPGG